MNQAAGAQAEEGLVVVEVPAGAPLGIIFTWQPKFGLVCQSVEEGGRRVAIIENVHYLRTFNGQPVDVQQGFQSGS